MLEFKRDVNGPSSDWCTREVSTDHKQYLKILSEHINPDVVQKTALLGTANILRSVLSINTNPNTSITK